MLLRNAFKYYVLLCANNALKQNTVHSFMVSYLSVLSHNAAKHVYVLNLPSFCNYPNVNNNNNFICCLLIFFNKKYVY